MLTLGCTCGYHGKRVAGTPRVMKAMEKCALRNDRVFLSINNQPLPGEVQEIPKKPLLSVMTKVFELNSKIDAMSLNHNKRFGGELHAENSCYICDVIRASNNLRQAMCLSSVRYVAFDPGFGKSTETVVTYHIIDGVTYVDSLEDKKS
jgi:hypothetical protein